MTFEEDTWQKVDKLRGEIPRSRFLEKIVVLNLGIKND